ncbi:MipA/OmpV family protein [Parvibium lacunae]|nr:MipA/OmpV family protein [Parvibium lacunae]
MRHLFITIVGLAGTHTQCALAQAEPGLQLSPSLTLSREQTATQANPAAPVARPLLVTATPGTVPISAPVPAQPKATPPVPKWELGLGAGALSFPHYRGADQQQTTLLPIPYIVYRGDKIRADRGGIRGHVVDTGTWDLDLSLAAGLPVNSDKNEARRGMPGLKTTLELGPQLVLNVMGRPRDNNYLSVRLPVRKVFALSSEQFTDPGWAITPNVNLNLRNSVLPKWNVGLNAGLFFGDSANHRYYYGVAPQYAAPNRPAYEAKAGFGGTQLTASLSRRIDRWWIGGFARMSSVAGAVFADSPLVKQQTNYYLGVGVSYIFAQSQESGVRFDE